MGADTAISAESGLPRRRAVAFIILLGTISLFADMTYEGAEHHRPYLGVLGVTATTIGVVSGFGELVGYAVRLDSGYLADRSGRYWTVTIFGCLLNLLAVPLLALAGNWQIAVVPIIADRMGRAVRSPPRDAMLSHAAGQTGLGFGLHQAARPDRRGRRPSKPQAWRRPFGSTSPWSPSSPPGTRILR
jgi:MFS family permease